MRLLITCVFLLLAGLPVSAQTTFDATGQSFNFSGGTVSGSGVNSYISFSNVVTVGGAQIDAKVTLTALSGASLSTFDSASSPYAAATFLQPNLNISSVGGHATFRIDFLRAGQPVTLQNFYVNTYDLDGAGAAPAGRQYTDFSGFASYSLSSPTSITRQAITGGTRFITTVGGNLEYTVGSNDFNTIRARVFYTSASSITVSVGDSGATGLAYFALDFSQGYTFSNIAVDGTAPVVTAGQSYSYAENQTQGAALATVAASDGVGVVSYRFSATSTATSADGYFTINGSGVVSLTAAGVAAASNDYEALPNQFVMGVQAADAAGNWSAAVDVTLNVTDLADSANAAPVFTGTTTVGGAEVYAFSYAEGATVATVLGTVAATDAESEAVTYAITAGNADGWYSLDPATGVLTLTAAGVASLANDFEQTPNTGSLTVTATDGTNTTTITVQLTETDIPDSANAAPVFTGTTTVGGAEVYAFRYAEGATVATVLGTVAATDAESEAVTYTITAGNGDGWYSLDPGTGVLTLTAAGVASLANDFEQAPNTGSLTVTASDGTNTTTITVQLTETDRDDTAPVLTGRDGQGALLAAGAIALSIPERTTAVAQISADEPLQGWTLGGTDAAVFSMDAEGRITFTLPPEYDTPADGDGDNVYLLTVEARDLAGNLTQLSVTITVTRVLYPGQTLPAGEDLDQDGSPDVIESATADRDGDGIADARDYDPQGYFYCRADGRILTGGRVSVSGPGTVTMVKDGQATGEYQWFVDAPGTYAMTIDTSGMEFGALSRASAGTLVLASATGNPIVIGSTEDGSTGRLGQFNGVSYNPDMPTAYYTSFTIAAGDPNVFGNNIPVEGCEIAAVTVTASQNARERNRDIGQAGIFVVTLGAVSAVDTVVSYSLSGTATEGVDFDALSGTVTIPAGQLSAEIEIMPQEDDLADGGETVELRLTAVAGNSATVLGASPTATLSIADDLMDENRAAVTAILQEDFDRVIGQQSAHFSDLSKAALARLQDGAETGCADAALASLRTMPIRFAAGQAVLPSDAGPALDDLAEVLAGCALRRFEIGVHADEASTAEANLQLSAARALALREALVLRGITATRLTAKGYGDLARKTALVLTEIGGGLGDDAPPCGAMQTTQRTGSADAGVEGGMLQGEITREGIDCATGERVLSFGKVSVTESATLGLQGMVVFTQARERQERNRLNGRFWGGYLSRTAVSRQDATGAITGFGLNAGLYGARGLGGGLFLDFYGAGALGYHSFGLRLSDSYTADGSYGYAALFGGVAVSGERAFDRVTLRPRAGFDVGYAMARDADVTIRDLTATDSGLVSLDPVLGLRAYIETAFVLEEKNPRPDGNRSHIELTPRLFCERGFGSAMSDCGIGFGLDYRAVLPDLTTWSFGLDLQHSRDADGAAVQVARVRPILSGAGAITTTLGVDAGGDPTIRQALDMRW